MNRILVIFKENINGYRYYAFTNLSDVEPFFDALDTKEFGRLEGCYVNGHRNEVSFNNAGLSNADIEIVVDSQAHRITTVGLW